METCRDDAHFDNFWALIDLDRKRLHFDEPFLPRKKKAPTRLEHYYAATHHHPETAVDMFRRIYFDALDSVIQMIRNRFEQKDWVVFRNMQGAFLNSLKGESFEENLDVVMDVYGDDLESGELSTQLDNLRFYADESVDTARDLVKFLQSLSKGQKMFMPQVVILAKLLLVMPATNAISERFFSALKRVKTYLRNTVTDKRLNNLLVLHVHKDMTDAIDLVDVANEFVQGRENRIQIFGKFSKLESKNTKVLLPRHLYPAKDSATGPV